MLIAVFASAGCGGKTTASGKVDVNVLEKAFSATDPASKEVINKAITAINAADYPRALTELVKFNNIESLTPEQRQAVDKVTHQVVTLLPPPPTPMAPMVPTNQ